MKTLKEYTDANRQAWNVIMPSHQQVNRERLDREFTQSGHQVFEPEEYAQTDVFDIPTEYKNRFDIIYISSGALGWIPDINLFFDKAQSLLTEQGHIFIHEIHPVCEMLSQDHDAEANPLLIIEPYFKDEPYEDTTGLDYVGKSTNVTPTQYWFVWSLSEVFTGLISNQLSIELFNEYAQDISHTHNRNEAAGIKIPMSYIMIAKKGRS